MAPKTPQTVTFLTVPNELLPIAHAHLSALIAAGHAPKCEHSEMDFPEIATIFVKDAREKRFFIFDAKVKSERAQLWANYGRSCSSGTYISLCLPKNADVKIETIRHLQALGVGLTVIGDANDMTVIVPAIDLSINVTLPPIDRHARKRRPPLAKIHASFTSGDWKHGFEEACKLVESTARNYLLKQIKLRGNGSPVYILANGKTKALNEKQVKRMPLGALADVFCALIAPKAIDSQLCTGLKGINSDRINVAHSKLDSRKERRLRSNVGKHMWTIDNLLRGIPL